MSAEKKIEQNAVPKILPQVVSPALPKVREENIEIELRPAALPKVQNQKEEINQAKRVDNKDSFLEKIKDRLISAIQSLPKVFESGADLVVGGIVSIFEYAACGVLYISSPFHKKDPLEVLGQYSSKVIEFNRALFNDLANSKINYLIKSKLGFKLFTGSVFGSDREFANMEINMGSMMKLNTLSHLSDATMGVLFDSVDIGINNIERDAYNKRHNKNISYEQYLKLLEENKELQERRQYYIAAELVGSTLLIVATGGASGQTAMQRLSRISNYTKVLTTPVIMATASAASEELAMYDKEKGVNSFSLERFCQKVIGGSANNVMFIGGLNIGTNAYVGMKTGVWFGSREGALFRYLAKAVDAESKQLQFMSALAKSNKFSNVVDIVDGFADLGKSFVGFDAIWNNKKSFWYNINNIWNNPLNAIGRAGSVVIAAWDVKDFRGNAADVQTQVEEAVTKDNQQLAVLPKIIESNDINTSQIAKTRINYQTREVEIILPSLEAISQNKQFQGLSLEKQEKIINIFEQHELKHFEQLKTEQYKFDSRPWELDAWYETATKAKEQGVGIDFSGAELRFVFADAAEIILPSKLQIKKWVDKTYAKYQKGFAADIGEEEEGRQGSKNSIQDGLEKFKNELESENANTQQLLFQLEHAPELIEVIRKGGKLYQRLYLHCLNELSSGKHYEAAINISNKMSFLDVRNKVIDKILITRLARVAHFPLRYFYEKDGNIYADDKGALRESREDEENIWAIDVIIKGCRITDDYIKSNKQSVIRAAYDAYEAQLKMSAVSSPGVDNPFIKNALMIDQIFPLNARHRYVCQKEAAEFVVTQRQKLKNQKTLSGDLFESKREYYEEKNKFIELLPDRRGRRLGERGVPRYILTDLDIDLLEENSTRVMQNKNFEKQEFLEYVKTLMKAYLAGSEKLFFFRAMKFDVCLEEVRKPFALILEDMRQEIMDSGDEIDFELVTAFDKKQARDFLIDSEKYPSFERYRNAQNAAYVDGLVIELSYQRKIVVSNILSFALFDKHQDFAEFEGFYKDALSLAVQGDFTAINLIRSIRQLALFEKKIRVEYRKLKQVGYENISIFSDVERKDLLEQTLVLPYQINNDTKPSSNEQTDKISVTDIFTLKELLKLIQNGTASIEDRVYAFWVAEKLGNLGIVNELNDFFEVKENPLDSLRSNEEVKFALRQKEYASFRNLSIRMLSRGRECVVGNQEILRIKLIDYLLDVYKKEAKRTEEDIVNKKGELFKTVQAPLGFYDRYKNISYALSPQALKKIYKDRSYSDSLLYLFSRTIRRHENFHRRYKNIGQFGIDNFAEELQVWQDTLEDFRQLKIEVIFLEKGFCLIEREVQEQVAIASNDTLKFWLENNYESFQAPLMVSDASSEGGSKGKNDSSIKVELKNIQTNLNTIIKLNNIDASSFDLNKLLESYQCIKVISQIIAENDQVKQILYSSNGKYAELLSDLYLAFHVLLDNVKTKFNYLNTGNNSKEIVIGETEIVLSVYHDFIGRKDFNSRGIETSLNKIIEKLIVDSKNEVQEQNEKNEKETKENETIAFKEAFFGFVEKGNIESLKSLINARISAAKNGEEIFFDTKMFRMAIDVSLTICKGNSKKFALFSSLISYIKNSPEGIDTEDYARELKEKFEDIYYEREPRISFVVQEAKRLIKENPAPIEIVEQADPLIVSAETLKSLFGAGRRIVVGVGSAGKIRKKLENAKRGGEKINYEEKRFDKLIGFLVEKKRFNIAANLLNEVGIPRKEEDDVFVEDKKLRIKKYIEFIKESSEDLILAHVDKYREVIERNIKREASDPLISYSGFNLILGLHREKENQKQSVSLNSLIELLKEHPDIFTHEGVIKELEEISDMESLFEKKKGLKEFFKKLAGLRKHSRDFEVVDPRYSPLITNEQVCTFYGHSTLSLANRIIENLNPIVLPLSSKGELKFVPLTTFVNSLGDELASCFKRWGNKIQIFKFFLREPRFSFTQIASLLGIQPPTLRSFFRKGGEIEGLIRAADKEKSVQTMRLESFLRFIDSQQLYLTAFHLLRDVSIPGFEVSSLRGKSIAERGNLLLKAFLQFREDSTLEEVMNNLKINSRTIRKNIKRLLNKESLSTGEIASSVGVSSQNTVQKWINEGVELVDDGRFKLLAEKQFTNKKTLYVRISDLIYFLQKLKDLHKRGLIIDEVLTGKGEVKVKKNVSILALLESGSIDKIVENLISGKKKVETDEGGEEG